MAHRSQSSSLGENPLHPNYLRPHYREEYRMAIDALLEENIEGYYSFIQTANVCDFLSRPEIDYIKSSVQSPQSATNLPELLYGDTDQDGSSDTYWPLHSDRDVPGLDLGWPLQQHSFVGPTEVTTLVNPPDPDMQSIKEQARRLIRTAHQVIAVVMDMFTDIDIFADLLDAAARHVPVYILLDKHNAHHFVAMVTSCKVNLDMVHMMRVRTVTGMTYFCRTGKSFKGQVMDRFLLADCRAVLSGNYSFMWSFEKIHRCIAHLFLGELVSTFDEEFRILFAQSQPLVVENALVPVPQDSTVYFENQFGLKRTQSLRNARGFAAYQFGDGVDPVLPFRRDDPFHHTLEAGATQVTKYSSQQVRTQHSFLDQGRLTFASRQLEMNTFKRHSYAECTQEMYAASRQFMKRGVMNNLQETEQHYYQGEGGGADFEPGRYDRTAYGTNQTDHYSDFAYPPELEAPGNLNVLATDDAEERRYDLQSHKRPAAAHAYACQSSITQPDPPDHKQMFSTGEQMRHSKDPSVKQGLRRWRINSYLNTCEDEGEEGLTQPTGPDAFDEPQQQTDSKPYRPERPAFYFNTNLHTKPNLDLWPRLRKPTVQERNQVPDIISDEGHTGPETVLKSAISATSLASSTEEKEVEDKDTRKISITKHESFHSRINPMLQRSSRLRSSLIFTSPNLEQYSSSHTKSGAELQEESKPVRYSSIVAEILEKGRPLSREPFDWSNHKKTDSKNSSTGDLTTTLQDATNIKEEKPDKPEAEEQNKVTLEPPDTSTTQQTSSYLNMNDPASRLQYFKELAAKRKAPKLQLDLGITIREPAVKSDISDSSTATKTPNMSITTTKASSTVKTQEPEVTQTEPAEKHPDISPKPFGLSVDRQYTNSRTLTEHKIEALKEPAKEPNKTMRPVPSPKFLIKPSQTRPILSAEKILTDATDSEKSELQKTRSFKSSGITHTESKESPNLTHQCSSTSLNLVGSDGKDTKALDLLKKQTQRLKGFLEPKGDKKHSGVLGFPEDKTMKTVPEVQEEPSDKETHSESSSTTVGNNKSSSKSTQSRYQTSTSSVLFSSNLRDDTKVILEQISANSQKNRQELAKQAEESEKNKGNKEDSNSSVQYQSQNWSGRSPVNPQDRDSLLKRIESMRREKKVYSRFEMGNNLK